MVLMIYRAVIIVVIIQLGTLYRFNNVRGRSVYPISRSTPRCTED